MVDTLKIINSHLDHRHLLVPPTPREDQTVHLDRVHQWAKQQMLLMAHRQRDLRWEEVEVMETQDMTNFLGNQLSAKTTIAGQVSLKTS